MLNRPKTLTETLPYILILTGLIGFLMSAILTIETLAVLENPDYIPPCNLNPFLSCSSVMDAPQSALFGFPNSLFGVAGFPIVATIGFALLAGAQFKRWFWIGLQLGVTSAVAAIYWLFYQSVFVINSLCPLCLIFWAATIPLCYYVTVYNLREKHITLPRSISNFLEQNTPIPLLVMYGIIVLSILIRFWSFWRYAF